MRVMTQSKAAQVKTKEIAMSMKMEEDFKRWTAKRKSASVVDIIQGKTTVAEASRS